MYMDILLNMLKLILYILHNMYKVNSMAFNQVKYQNDFNKEKYDRVSINFPKGRKAIIEEHYKANGYKSLNAYVNALIDADMNK